MPEELQHSHSVILLTYKRVDLAAARLTELRNFYRNEPQVQIVVVNNGGQDVKTKIELGLWKQNFARMQGSKHCAFGIHEIVENCGFGRGMNWGANKAYFDVLHFLSDDVQIFGDFIRRVDEEIERFPDAIIGAEAVNWEAGWNQFGSTKITYLQGYYLAMGRPLWQELGGFDPDFYPYDYEDVDLCYRAHLAGKQLYMMDLPLRHQAAGTIGYNPERYEHTVKMRALFASKHGLENVPERP